MIMTEREKAIQWWNNQNHSVRHYLTNKYYSGRLISSLTGREIEKIYKNEYLNV